MTVNIGELATPLDYLANINYIFECDSSLAPLDGLTMVKNILPPAPVTKQWKNLRLQKRT